MTEGRSLAHVRADARTFQVSLDETSALILSNFITYGVSERTRALGSGERRALVRDAMQTMGRSDILMYRIRFPRDLNAEREGIKEFRSLFGRAPQDPFQWATVRVLGYVDGR